MTDEKLPNPLEKMRTITTDTATWLAKRERHGATRVDMDEMYQDAVVNFPISTNKTIAEPCVEMSEFIAAAARSAVNAVEVLDRLNTEDDPHLVAALKRYVEDTGQALKEVDNRLKKLHSGSERAVPRDSIVEKSHSSSRCDRTQNTHSRRRQRSGRKRTVTTGKLCQLLSNIHFAPTIIDLEQGVGPKVRYSLQFSCERLAPSAAGQDGFVPGGALVIVCLDARKGIVTFRLGRGPDNQALLAMSHAGRV